MTIPAKSLLIGASGQLGAQMLTLLGAGRCLATSRRAVHYGELALDLATIATIADAEAVVGMHTIDVIYCIAGMATVDACEDAPDRAHRTNCRGPEMLAGLAGKRGIPFVYLSTEYVFDGAAGPYREDDTAHPLSVYGQSKRQGELAVLAACSEALVLRSTVVYGQDCGEKNYIYSLMRSLAAGRRMCVPEDQISTPTYNRNLAAATIALAERGASGIYHVCGPERMGRLEFARAVARFLSLDASLLIGVPTSALGQKAQRPLSAGLASDKLRRLHPDIAMRPLVQGLADCRAGLETFLASCCTPA